VETPGVELLKVGEGLTANPEPSPSDREGVETGRAAPKAVFGRDGEGTVQTTNPSGAAKAEVVWKSRAARRPGSSPGRATNVTNAETRN